MITSYPCLSSIEHADNSILRLIIPVTTQLGHNMEHFYLPIPCRCFLSVSGRCILVAKLFLDDIIILICIAHPQRGKKPPEGLTSTEEIANFKQLATHPVTIFLC